MMRMRPARRSGSRLPRGGWRAAWDWLLAFAILGLLVVLAARLDRTETRTLEGRVTVAYDDAMTITRVSCG